MVRHSFGQLNLLTHSSRYYKRVLREFADHGEIAAIYTGRLNYSAESFEAIEQVSI